MDQKQFLTDPEVIAFVEWLSSFAGTVKVNLNIGRSVRVPGGIIKTVHGFNEVVDTYVWRASWDDSNGDTVQSLCWDSTARSLFRIGDDLRGALKSGSDGAAMRACNAILMWGGERNGERGARPFLEKKVAAGQLVTYLNTAREVFSLGGGHLDRLGAIEVLNSMLTKVHALASDDGLPIYDSRVAAAIAALVEIFRVKNRRGWKQIPEKLLFPTMATESRRRVARLHPGALVSDGAQMYYGRPELPTRWADAKLRLGWIVNAVLKDSPHLLGHQPHSRQHAFEASLFMIGYDVQCLSQNVG